jgi:hypothetical protein
MCSVRILVYYGAHAVPFMFIFTGSKIMKVFMNISFGVFILNINMIFEVIKFTWMIFHAPRWRGNAGGNSTRFNDHRYGQGPPVPRIVQCGTTSASSNNFSTRKRIWDPTFRDILTCRNLTSERDLEGEFANGIILAATREWKCYGHCGTSR